MVTVFFSEEESERESEPGGQMAEAVTETLSDTERQRKKILSWPKCSLGFSAPPCGNTQTFWLTEYFNYPLQITKGAYYSIFEWL